MTKHRKVVILLLKGNDNIMKPKEFAKLVGVTTTTLRNWDRSGKLVPKRTLSNQRYYDEDDYNKVFGINSSKQDRKNYIYARVSTRNQKDDLKNQVDFIREFTNSKGVIVEKVLTDIGSGLNYKRTNWNKLLDLVMADKVDNIYISYKDRFVRFGFDWFESLCTKHHTKIIIINNEETSPEKEIISDLISIIHLFSCRIYGLRKYKHKIEDDKDVKNL